MEDERDRPAFSRAEGPSSVLPEIKRQSGVFFDDVTVDEEVTGESEDHLMAVVQSLSEQYLAAY